MKIVRLLALSGSLRQGSYNTAAIKALCRLAADHIDIKVGSIADLPLFNPDLDENSLPPVLELSKALSNADGLVIASPEYAHGISGPMKNALDWLVGGEAFPDKPIMLINTSPRASHAQAALREVLKTMSGNVIEKASLSLPLLGSELDVEGILQNTEISNALIQAVEVFCEEIELLRSVKEDGSVLKSSSFTTEKTD